MNQERAQTDSRPVIASLNPATGELLRSFEPHSSQDISGKLEKAQRAFSIARRKSFAERAELMNKVGELIESEKLHLAQIMTLEMGKPLAAAVQEAEKCAIACRYYAQKAQSFLAPETAWQTVETRCRVRYEPLGVVLAVMPWNFPFWQVFRFAAPALMAGNVALLKHASNVPQCALAIEDLFRRGGDEMGAFQALLVKSADVEPIIEDKRVAAVTLTGSVEAGSKVAAIAGRRIKKTVLELGGSDPFVVMPSANLAEATATAVQARIINNGQSCIAAKRFIVHQDIADAFEDLFVRTMKSLKLGDPMDEQTHIGPLATREVRDSLHNQVQKSVSMGARLLLGGQPLPGPGFFYQPTVLADLPLGSPGQCEELFGPVACIYRAKDIYDALRIANDTDFGLGSCIWTQDERERRIFIEEIQAGIAFVNGMVASDPRAPFGGIKQSGYGRELAAPGIREFVNVKTVVEKWSTSSPGAATE